METFLLTAMGLFGVVRGLAVLVNARTRQGTLLNEGSADRRRGCESNLARIAEHYLPERSLPLHAEFVLPGRRRTLGSCRPTPRSFSNKRWTAAMRCLRPSAQAYRGTIRRCGYDRPAQLAGTMANVLAQNLFHRKIQHLSAGLIRQGNELQDAQHQAGRAHGPWTGRSFTCRRSMSSPPS